MPSSEISPSSNGPLGASPGESARRRIDPPHLVDGAPPYPTWGKLLAWYRGLTPAGQSMLLMHYADGHSVADIAAILGLAEGTVERQLAAFRCRAAAIVGVPEEVERSLP